MRSTYSTLKRLKVLMKEGSGKNLIADQELKKEGKCGDNLIADQELKKEGSEKNLIADQELKKEGSGKNLIADQEFPPPPPLRDASTRLKGLIN